DPVGSQLDGDEARRSRRRHARRPRPAGTRRLRMRDRLRALPLFADLDDEQIDMLAAVTTELVAPAGRTLITRGEAGSGLFVLEEGGAIVESPEGQHELGPGDVFGERSLVGEDIRRT